MSDAPRTVRLLCVEDTEDDYQLVCEELRAAGLAIHSSRVACNAGLREALNGSRWDMVLTDHNLPDLDSGTVYDIVREYAVDLPVVIVSGEIDSKDAAAAMRRGVRDYLRKDDLARLVAVIEREIREAHARDDLRWARESLRNLSYYDSLTGLPNREFLLRHLRERLLETTEDGPGPVLLIADLNRFSAINREFGMAHGNQLLLQVTERLRGRLGENDFLARVGPDRFAVVLAGQRDSGDSEAVSAVPRQAFELPFMILNEPLRVTCSIGAACHSMAGRNADVLFRNAETALYAAKQMGRGRVERYRESMGEEVRRKSVLESALLQALHEQQFAVVYQPQIDLKSGQVIGAEVLARWRHPELGSVPPPEFIPVLEESGLIVPVGDWILRRVCRDIALLDARHIVLPRVSINISVVQFQQRDFAATMRRVLAEEQLPPERIEITENIALRNEDATAATLSELRDMGMRIAIDDFGIGYSSLAYLKRFALDCLKIDQSFVRHPGGGLADVEIVKTIISLGKGLGLDVIAEGVETESQAAQLRQYGCDFAQGHLYSPGIKREDLEQSLATGLKPAAATASSQGARTGDEGRAGAVNGL